MTDPLTFLKDLVTTEPFLVVAFGVVFLYIMTQIGRRRSKPEKFSYSKDWKLIVEIDAFAGYSIYRNEEMQLDVLVHDVDEDVVKYGPIGFFEESLEK